MEPIRKLLLVVVVCWLEFPFIIIITVIIKKTTHLSIQPTFIPHLLHIDQLQRSVENIISSPSSTSSSTSQKKNNNNNNHHVVKNLVYEELNLN
jgi:hypothetical protein